MAAAADDDAAEAAPSSHGAPEGFCCPITHKVMKDPVLCADTHSYERKAIVEWFEKKATSPVTGEMLKTKELRANVALKDAIEDWKRTKFTHIDDKKLVIGAQFSSGSFKQVFHGTYAGVVRHAMQWDENACKC